MRNCLTRPRSARRLGPPSWTALLALPLLLASVARGQTPADVGQFEGPWDWFCQVCPSTCCPGFPDPPPPCATTYEFSHAALIPHGPFQGKVLIWGSTRQLDPAQTDAWIFDPSAPQKLLSVRTRLPSSIFCSGMTWDTEGQLLIVGGQTSIPPSGCDVQVRPVESYHFLPGALEVPAIQPAPCEYGQVCCESPYVTGSPWLKLGDQSTPRYYPSAITLLAADIVGSDILGGSGFVLGGAPSTCFDPDTDPVTLPVKGTTRWQVLEPDAGGVWGTTFYTTQDTTPNENGVIEPAPNLPREPYTLHPPADPPEPTLDSYPHARQLADTQGSKKDILIANDVDSFTLSEHSDGNEPGDVWVIKLRYPDGPTDTQLWRATSSTTADSLDRLYNGTVLIHELLNENRVLSFGGSQFRNGIEEANPTVQEFIAGADPATGSWHQKDNVNAANGVLTPRRFVNAVVLPTGEILLIGGTLPASPVAIPVHQPELYDPGADAIADGSSRLMAMPPNAPGSANPFPRQYHNFAVLLSDGRVFNAGGDPNAGAAYADSRFSGEVFCPPYLYYGFRPSIVATETDTWDLVDPGPGEWIDVVVQHTECVDKFVLIRPAAITHNYDADQRYVELEWAYENGSPTGDCVNDSRFTVRAPRVDLAPPGYYMLFVVTKKVDGGTTLRVPSVARFVKLVAP